jgi:hypothetical protein
LFGLFQRGGQTLSRVGGQIWMVVVMMKAADATVIARVVGDIPSTRSRRLRGPALSRQYEHVVIHAYRRAAGKA